MKTDSAELYSITNLVDYAGQHTQRGLAFAWREGRRERREPCGLICCQGLRSNLLPRPRERETLVLRSDLLPRSHVEQNSARAF